ncbi:MAG: SHOCT domain-containing protein [Chitinophagaceae bacterium]
MNFQTLNKQRKFILIAALLGVIAAFLPWKTVSAGLFGQSMSEGISGFNGIGILTFLAFVVAGILAIAGDQLKPLDKTMWLGALAAGVIALIGPIVNIINTSGSGLGFVEISVGFGCWIALVAALGVAGSAWLFKSPEDSLKGGLDSLKKNIATITPTVNNSTATTPPANTKTNTNSIAELERLIQLKNAGHISEDEYQQMKSKIL